MLSARSLPGIPPSEHQVPYKNIGELLETQVRRYGDDTWLIFYPDTDGRLTSRESAVPDVSGNQRRAYTYRQFHDQVCTAADVLVRQGIARGDRIATIATNHADTVIQYFAAWMIGAVVVPVNVGEDDKRIRYILQNSQAKLAFVREEFVPRIEGMVRHDSGAMTIVPVGSSFPAVQGDAARQEFRPPIHDRSGERPPGRSLQAGTAGNAIPHRTLQDTLAAVSLEDEALIVYTSGTTGLPKGVVLTQYNLLVDAKAIAEWHGMRAGERMMCVLPIHHVNGTVVTLLTPMVFGGSVVLNQKFHSDRFFKRVAQEKVHVVSVVPTLLQFLLHHDGAMGDLSSLRHIICGAGPLTCELAMQFEQRFGIPIIHGYGLSETTCYSCFLPLDLSPDEHRHWLKDFGLPSIGVPIPSNEMAIHDEHGNELPEGTKGEIVIRGHNVMKEYFADPGANEKTFIHGWFKSGDEGLYRTDRSGRKYFFISGRIKELIIRGGVNISPFEIDELLMNMPGVQAGLAVGFENDWYGEEVGAYVRCAEGTPLSAEEVIQYMRDRLPFQKCPKVVVFGNDIPVTSTGKYQRNKLRPLFEQWKTVQFSESAAKTNIKR